MHATIRHHGETGAPGLNCDETIPPGDTRFYALHGYVDRAGRWINIATASGTADGVSLETVQATSHLHIARL